MKRLLDLAQEKNDLGVIVTITSVFEGLASMRLGQIKNQVQLSQAFFEELWHIYSQIRVDRTFRYGRETNEHVIDKELIIAITAEGGFSGDIDQKLIEWMLKEYNPEKQDIIIVGHHGALQLVQAGVKFKKYFKLPARDQNINVTPLVQFVHEYRNTTVYYQTYVSLMVQDIKKIELRTAVQEAGRRLKEEEDTINEATYIFEPSTFAVVAHLERSMVEIALSQTILESKLAQYASRFRSMNVANDKAAESQRLINLAYNRAKRATADERLKETINGIRQGAAVL
ncbi:MAG TPA: F0F1 ATP synthase subunit gamma [Candidatus Saccharimonadales bacterium]|nr:F0F1 ATP synthase subunit gamma [Candidatus Saccharimonadales bacterium]